MGKRYTFKCWKCNKEYTLFKEITDEQKLIVACPYCGEEAVVTLEPYKKEVKEVLKGDSDSDQTIGFEYEFPEVIPTEKPDRA